MAIPADWAPLDLAELRGTVLIVGASDTGKSTLARHLFRLWCQRGVRAAYLDADVGQSTLGLPTTLTMQMVGTPGDDGFPPRGPRAAFFVGATTPRGHMLPVLVGLWRLQQKALSLGAEAVVVDTTGLVEAAQGGTALKQWKIELLRPASIIALQRSRELEPILWPLRREGRLAIVEMQGLPLAVERSREARVAWRQALLARYFEGARAHVVSLRRTAVYDLDRLAPGALLAFQDGEGFVLALGAVERIDGQGATAVVRTPLPTLNDVHSVRLGSTRWNVGAQREM